MYSKSIFIDFPWSHISFNGVHLSEVQIQSAYEIVINAIKCKLECEKLKENQKNYDKYDLDNPKVFLSFRNKIISKISDKTATEYLLKCVTAIRKGNFKNISVKESFQTLNKCLIEDTFKSKIIKQALADKKSFINFPDIIKHFEIEPMTENSDIMQRINVIYEKYKDKYLDYIK